MDEKGKFFKKELDKKDFTHKDALRAVKTWFTVYSDTGGYVRTEMTMHLFADGIVLSDDGSGFISIHDKEIMNVLRELLAESPA
jgi:hypothetical protein